MTAPDTCSLAPGPRVLVVEDDHSTRSAIALALHDEGYEVSAYPDGQAMSPSILHAVDLAIIDVWLGTPTNGLDLARALNRAHDPPVILVTAADSFDDIAAGYRAGADHYVVKPFSLAELLLRVRALLRRAGRLSPVWQVGPVLVEEAAHKATHQGQDLGLTRTEFALLCALLRRRGQALSKRQLLAEVWGYEGYNLNLVEVHLSSLRRKVRTVISYDPVITVRGVGYRLDHDKPE